MFKQIILQHYRIVNSARKYDIRHNTRVIFAFIILEVMRITDLSQKVLQLVEQLKISGECYVHDLGFSYHRLAFRHQARYR